MATIAQTIKRAVKTAEREGITRYRIGQDARVDYSVLVRFLDQDANCQLSTVQRLADYFKLELTPKANRRE